MKNKMKNRDFRSTSGGVIYHKNNSLKPEKLEYKNNKRKIIFIVLVLSIFSLVSLYLYKTYAVFSEEKHFNVINGTVQDPGDIYFSYYVDNKISLEPPISNSDYTLDTKNSNCTNDVTVSWNNTTKSLNVNYQNYKSSGYSKTRCTLYFKKNQTTTSLIDKVKSLEGKTNMTTDGFYNIRYIGSSPSNYVYFNCSDYNNPSSSTCEKWRIIGLMKDIKTSTNETKDLIKIIRNDTLESVTFGYINNFADSQLKTTLTNVLKNDVTKNLVENVVWPLGGTSTIKSPYEMYSLERGTAVYNGNATTVTTKVGLMYPSDYGYATSGVVVNNMEVCSKTSMDKWDTYSNCAGGNWLKPTGIYPELTMTQNTGYSHIMYGVGTDGILTNALVQLASGDASPYNNAKPVVYLSTSLNISGGTGSSSSPYTLTTSSSDNESDTAALSNGKYLDENVSNCNNNVTISWNATTNKVIINFQSYKISNKQRTKCNLYFKYENPTAAQSIITLAQTDTTNLVYDGTSDNNLRYIGADPNNYVKVDDELWRIIGVMNNIGDNKEQLIKLIRADSIVSSASWDAGLDETGSNEANGGKGINEWSNSDIMKLLNPGYENKRIGGSLYYNCTSGEIYRVKYYCLQCNANSIIKSNENFTVSGLKENLKSLIVETVWNTGAGSLTTEEDGLVSNLYVAERSNNTGKTCTSSDYCNDTVERKTTWRGKVGLMYPSDYLYATSGSETTDRATCLSQTMFYGNTSTGFHTGWNSYSDCVSNDWIKNGWTMTPAIVDKIAGDVFVVRDSVYANTAVMVNDIRPVVYLKSSVKIASGIGSESDPFILEE